MHWIKFPTAVLPDGSGVDIAAGEPVRTATFFGFVRATRDGRSTTWLSTAEQGPRLGDAAPVAAGEGRPAAMPRINGRDRRKPKRAPEATVSAMAPHSLAS